MPRVNSRPRRAAYWWSKELDSLRQSAYAKCRALKRARRRRGNNPEEIEEAAAAYRGASKALRAAIAAAKARAWNELLLTLEENPWGRPYQIVRKKLRRWAPSHTEALEASVLANVLGTLFPESTGEESPWTENPPVEGEWHEDLEVSKEELRGAVKRMQERNTAPGPNGVPGKIWALALKHIREDMRHLFTRCLKEGSFPSMWRRAKLYSSHRPDK